MWTLQSKVSFQIQFWRINLWYYWVLKTRHGSPYLILEAYSGNKLQCFGVYILCLNDKSVFTIGRANDADIRVSDISVSLTCITYIQQRKQFTLY